MGGKVQLKHMKCSFDGRLAYIYLWYSKKWRIVYVGQTNGINGTIGRAINHIQPDGTLRKCFKEETGLPLEYASDLYLLSFPKDRVFTSAESSYRLAVEYRVQTKLLKIRGEISPCFKIISNVTYTDIASNQDIIKLADDIVEQFVNIYLNSYIDYE